MSHPVAYNHTQPVPGNIYAINSGDFMGEFFVLMEKLDDYVFLSLPDFYIRKVPIEKYNLGIKDKIVTFQESLPEDIFSECIKKYNKIKSCKSA